MFYCFSGPAAAAHLCEASRGKLPAGLGGAGRLPWFTCASARQAALAGWGWETVRRAHAGENAGGARSVWAKPHHTSELCLAWHAAVMFNDGGLSSSLATQNDWWIPVCRADRGSSEPAAQRRRQSESTGQVRRGEIIFYVRNVNRSRAGV